MKYGSKSARNALATIFFIPLCLLTGCADVPLPTWMTGEPDPSVLQAPRVVSTPANDGHKDWPNLADVPDTKPVFTSEPVRNRRAEDLNSDRLKGLAEMERIRNVDLYGAPSQDSNMPAQPFSFSALGAGEAQ